MNNFIDTKSEFPFGVLPFIIRINMKSYILENYLIKYNNNDYLGTRHLFYRRGFNAIMCPYV